MILLSKFQQCRPTSKGTLSNPNMGQKSCRGHLGLTWCVTRLPVTIPADRGGRWRASVHLSLERRSECLHGPVPLSTQAVAKMLYRNSKGVHLNAQAQLSQIYQNSFWTAISRLKVRWRSQSNDIIFEANGHSTDASLWESWLRFIKSLIYHVQIIVYHIS